MIEHSELTNPLIPHERGKASFRRTGSLGMTKTLVTVSRALVIVAALAIAPTAAKAQSLGGSTAASSFDAYRAMAITAGVVGGAVIATIVTDGLILPVLASGGINGGAANVATRLISASGTVFGAISGGMFADDWYSKQ